MLRRSAIILAVLGVFTASLQGVTYEVPSDAELVRRVELIVSGEVVESRVMETERGIETIYTFAVENVLKGHAPSRVEIRQPGGQLPSGKWMMIPGAPQLAPGERGLAMLSLRNDRSYGLRSLGLGWFAEERGIDGSVAYVRELGESEDPARDAERFRRWIAGDREIEYVLPHHVRAPIARSAIEPNAGYSAKAYLKEFEPGKPAGWQQSPAIQFRFASTSASQQNEAEYAMFLWHSVEPSVTFATGVPYETPEFPDPDNPNEELQGDDNINSFMFNVTNEDLAGADGVEASAWTQLYGSGASYSHPYTSETIYLITESDVFIKGSPSGSLLSQLLLHEIGHSLGFRHSNQGTPSSSQSVMYSSVSGSITSLQSWDQDAIQIVYGDGPSCDSFTASITVDRTEVVAGQSATLTATQSGGRGPFQYKWFRNGVQFGDAGTSSTTSTGALSQGTHDFTVEILDACSNSVTSAPVTVTASECVPAEILGVTPASTSVVSGQSTTISVSIAIGASTPVSYQWYKAPATGPFTAIAGASSATLNTGALTQKTRFYVTVTNPCVNATPSQEVTIDVTSGCESPQISAHPQSVSRLPGQTATLSVSATGTSLAYQWYEGAKGTTTNPVSGATQPTYTTPALTSTRQYWVRVSNSCGHQDSNAATVSVQTCAIQILSTTPSSQIVIGHTAELMVNATGPGTLRYQWYKGNSGNTSEPIPGATQSRFTTPAIGAATSFWVRVGNGTCSVDSQAITISVNCGTPPAPSVRVPGDVMSNVQYTVSWEAIPGVARYEIQESSNADFSGAVSFTVNGNARTFRHPVSSPARYYYRVRATASCNNSTGPFSAPLNIAIVPPPNGEELAPTVTVPVGTTGTVNWTYHLMPPSGGANSTFTASVDKPWLRVEPSSGTIPESGIDLTVYCTLDTLSAGTTTGTLTINVEPPTAGKMGNTSHGSKNSVPVSVSLVSPVTSKPKTSPDDQTVIIPGVGHAQGANHSQFQSDLRITNSSQTALEYILTYTPSGTDGTKSSKQTQLTIGAGETKAFNDIVKAWFGVGSTGDSGTGVLEIRPKPTAAGIKPSDGRSLATVATSRTYNLTSTGTFGQFIPAIPASEFLSAATAATSKISLQQIAESSAYRTNLGLVEGAGEPAEVEIRVYNATGTLVRTVNASLAPGEHRQINRFLQQNNAAVPDGRIEIRLTSSTGRVSAYASVIDNVTNDPMLVAPQVVSAQMRRSWLIPGVADLTNANASWRTDVRLFNAGASSARATMTFFPQNNSGAPTVRTVDVAAGQVVSMDGVLRTRFGIQNAGGAILITTSTDSNLVATARTYDQRPSGTYGQFIPAVTVEKTTGRGERSLELLQIEQSDRFRTNLGLAEMSGKPVTVEITAAVPGQLASPRIRWDLAANESTQLNAIMDRMQISTAYNARISVKVVSGDGRVGAYASVVDNQTQDPTYIPAQ